MGKESSSIILQDQRQITANLGLSVEISTCHLYGQCTEAIFEDLILTVTLGHTIVFIVVVIIDATSLQMRRGLAAKGHAQSHSAGEGPQWDCHQTLLLALSLGAALSTLHSHCGEGGEGARSAPRGENWFLKEPKKKSYSFYV